MDKKKIFAIALFFIMGFFMFTFANPSEETKKLGEKPKDETKEEVKTSDDVIEEPAILDTVVTPEVAPIGDTTPVIEEQSNTIEVTPAPALEENDEEEVDTTKPVITLNGGDIIIRTTDSYEELGATATDDKDGDITDKIVTTGNVDNEKGTYTIDYDVTDASGNAADTVTRTVNVVDVTDLQEDIEDGNSILEETEDREVSPELEDLLDELKEEIDNGEELIEDEDSLQDVIDEKENDIEEIIEKIRNLEFTVSFIDWDKTTDRIVKYNQTVSDVPEASNNQPGHIFSNWDGNYSNVMKDEIVNAEYNKQKYEVKFMNGDLIHDTQLIFYKDSANTPLDPIKDGYIFKNWDKSYNQIVSNLIINAIYEANKATANIAQAEIEGKRFAEPNDTVTYTLSLFSDKKVVEFDTYVVEPADGLTITCTVDVARHINCVDGKINWTPTNINEKLVINGTINSDVKANTDLTTNITVDSETVTSITTKVEVPVNVISSELKQDDLDIVLVLDASQSMTDKTTKSCHEEIKTYCVDSKGKQINGIEDEATCITNTNKWIKGTEETGYCLKYHWWYGEYKDVETDKKSCNRNGGTWKTERKVNDHCEDSNGNKLDNLKNEAACTTNINKWKVDKNDVCEYSTKLDDMKASAKQLVTDLVNNNNNGNISLSIIPFNRTANSNYANYTSLNSTNLNDALNKINAINWNYSTHLYSAAKAGYDKLNNNNKSKKFLIILSDGEPNDTKGNVVNTIKSNSNINVYAIGLGIDNNTTAQNALKEFLNDSTHYFSANDAATLNNAFQAISEDTLTSVQSEGGKIIVSNVGATSIELTIGSTIKSITDLSVTSLNENNITISGTNYVWDVSSYAGNQTLKIKINY